MNRLFPKIRQSLHGWLALAACSLLQPGCTTLRSATELTPPPNTRSERAVVEAAIAEPVFDASDEITENSPIVTTATVKSPPAGLQPLNFTMQAPVALQWKKSALSAGGRPLEYCCIGDGSFRTLVIGSTLGNDPVALELTEKLAVHLNENSLIYGGFQTLVIKTLNPDGEADGQSVNALGQIINRQFPTASNGQPSRCPEAELLMRLVRNEHPDRIVHIRSIRSPVGALGSDARSAPLVASVAQSLGFTRFLYPQDAAVGTLEHYCASGQKCQVLTFAFPEALSSTAAWNRYQDCLLTLVVNHSVTTTPLQTVGSNR